MNELLINTIKGNHFLSSLLSVTVVIIGLAIIFLIFVIIYRMGKAKKIKFGGRVGGQNFNLETEDAEDIIWQNVAYKNLFMHKMNEVLLLSEKKHLLKNEVRIKRMKSKVRVFSKKLINRIITHFTKLTEQKGLNNVYVLMMYKYIIGIAFEEIKEELYDRITQNNFDRFQNKAEWEFYKKEALNSYASILESVLNDMWIEDFILRKELKNHNNELYMYMMTEGNKLFEEILIIHNDIKNKIKIVNEDLQNILEKRRDENE